MPLRSQSFASAWNPKTLYGVIFLGGIISAVFLWAQSSGSPLDDEIAHVVMARNAWNYPELLLNTWGRVGNTLIYLAPSLLGLNGARLMSLIVCCLTVVVTTGVAREMGVRRLYLIPLLLWFQPWFLSLSFIALTEIPFMLFMILGIYLSLKDRFAWATLAAGMLPLIRHEGIAITGLWFLYLIATRHWREALLCWLPMIAYNLVYWAALNVPFNHIPFMLYLHPQPTTAYGSGSLLHFVPVAFVAIGPPVFLASLRGIRVAVSRRVRGRIFLLVYAAYFILHTLIYHFGLFASGGYGIFLFPIAPGMALLAALGVENLFERSDRTRQRYWPISPALVPVAMRGLAVALVLAVALFAPPWRATSEQAAVQAAAQWISQRSFPGTAVISSHAWFFYDYFYDYPWTTQQGWGLKLNLDELTPGTVLVWDVHYSSEAGRITLDDLVRPGSPWRELARFGDEQAIIFQKQ